ncbi:MAG: RidA family protein [Bacteroidetes bacterium]|jgi:2-iminobutanoate/2-iminopropanoate deaminase|nr:RidA family protein [Bacteroidota bacterium]
MIGEELRSLQQHEAITGAQTIGPYSPAVRAGGLLFVSGQLGLSPETGTFPGPDVETQTRQALINLGAILRQAGADSSHVVQCNVFLTDIRDFPKMNLIYGGFFPDGRYPARSTMEVRALPRQAVVEIAAIALLPQSADRH